MKISTENPEIGNKAMASALLLYYHLLWEDGITNDQTVYIDQNDFDGFSFLHVEVENDQDIDPILLQEASIVYLLCDLNDMVQEYEDDFWQQPISKKIIESYIQGSFRIIPETDPLFENIQKHENADFKKHQAMLDEIYKKYVVNRFKQLIENKL